MRLRTKFAVVFLAVTLVLSGSVLVVLEFYKRDAVDESRANVEETATLAADQIDAAIRDQRDYVGLVASRPRARQFEGSGAFLDSFLANSRFYAAQVVVANGTVVDFRGDVTAAQRRAVLGSDRSNATYVRAALAGRSYVGEAESVDGADAHVLVFSAPIFEDGEVEGVLAAAIYLDTRTVSMRSRRWRRADRRSRSPGTGWSSTGATGRSRRRSGGPRPSSRPGGRSPSRGTGRRSTPDSTG